MLRQTIRGVIFDMDGLLVDSEPLWRKAEIETFARVGLQLDDDLCRLTMGLQIHEVVAYWFARHPWQGMSRDELAAATVQRVVELIETQGRPQAGAYEALAFFEARRLPIALASSSDHSIIDAAVARLGLGRRIPTRCSAENEQYGKPHPGVYITAAREVGVPPHACLAIEDSPNGVLSAKAARMLCLAVPDPGVVGDPAFGIADAVIDSLADLDDSVLAAITP